MAPGAGRPVPAAADVECRALVTRTPPEPRREVAGGHRQAPFLAHLIATKDQHPQAREKRRAEPQEAIAAYRAGATLTRYA